MSSSTSRCTSSAADRKRVSRWPRRCWPIRICCCSTSRRTTSISTMLEWLETFLRIWGGACLIVSHDRYFPRPVTTRTLESPSAGSKTTRRRIPGYLNYARSGWTRRRKEYEEQQEFIARTEEFIRKYKAGQRSREAQGRQTRLDRLERIERPARAARTQHQDAAPRSAAGAGAVVNPLQAGICRDADGTPERRPGSRTPELIDRARRPRRPDRPERRWQNDLAARR